MEPVYLDCAATTPVEPRVLDVVLTYLRDDFGNAGSQTHGYGQRARAAVDLARAQVAAVVDADPSEVIFTSGATEANNLALLGLTAHGQSTGRRHLVATAIEHKSVLETLDALGKVGFEVDYVRPGGDGAVVADEVLAAVRPDTLAVSVMQVNNETGVCQPILAIAEGLADSPVYFHVDAAQGFGKELEPLRHRRIDLISVSGHKLFAPKGVGALVARRRSRQRPPLTPLLFGGGQERGLRPGTLAVPLIAGFGEAARLAFAEHGPRRQRCLALRHQLLDGLASLDPLVIGAGTPTVPHILLLAIPGVDADAAILALKPYVAISKGSACTSERQEPSHVLAAMSVATDVARGALRCSWSQLTPDPDVAGMVAALSALR